MPGQAIAYGVLLHLNGYDGQVWAYGKGPSAVTVTAPDIGVTTATPITITGTVLDVSAGTTQEQQKFDFPYGVPCVSDASQSAFMEYVYENQAEPTNTTGVPVTLTETDHNGNTYTIGTTRTDAMRHIRIHMDTSNRRQLHYRSNIRRLKLVLRINALKHPFTQAQPRQHQHQQLHQSQALQQQTI